MPIVPLQVLHSINVLLIILITMINIFYQLDHESKYFFNFSVLSNFNYNSSIDSVSPYSIFNDINVDFTQKVLCHTFQHRPVKGWSV